MAREHFVGAESGLGFRETDIPSGLEKELRYVRGYKGKDRKSLNGATYH